MKTAFAMIIMLVTFSVLESQGLMTVRFASAVMVACGLIAFVLVSSTNVQVPNQEEEEREDER